MDVWRNCETTIFIVEIWFIQLKQAFLMYTYGWWFRNPAPVDRWFIHVYPIIYRVLYISGPGGWEWDFWTINSSSLKEKLLWSYLSPVNRCKNSTVKFESETHGSPGQSFGTSQLMSIVLSACDEVEVATLSSWWFPVLFKFLPPIFWGNDPIWLILNHQLAVFFGSPEKKEVHDPVNQHSWLENGRWIGDWAFPLLNIGIFQPSLC